VHLRRALLLFAIVLALAALAASLSRPTDTDDRSADAPPPAATGSAPSATAGDGGLAPVDVSFDAADPGRERVEAGRPATVRVAVSDPGQVEIPSLGLTSAAEPLTPARFDVLADSPGSHRIRFTPAAGDESRAAGTLVVTEPRS
jgi:hypothetical protein